MPVQPKRVTLSAGVQSLRVYVSVGGENLNWFSATNFLTAALTSPTNGAVFFTSNLIPLTATASTTVGAVTNLRFFSGATGLATFTNTPYSLTLSNLAPGHYAFSAIVIDNTGRRATSAVVNITVVLGMSSAALFPQGAIWKYFDQTNDLGTAWRSNIFNDSSWRSGPAMLGFGDANGHWPTTTIASNKQWATYFRRTFYLPDVSLVAALSARLMRDDGAVIYVNGAEVWRDNLPAGLITNTTPAVTNITGALEGLWLTNVLSSANLVNGTNLLAVEIHQISLASNDVTFDLELEAGVLITAQPQLGAAVSGAAVLAALAGFGPGRLHPLRRDQPEAADLMAATDQHAQPGDRRLADYTATNQSQQLLPAASKMKINITPIRMIMKTNHPCASMLGVALGAALILLAPTRLQADINNPNTDWFSQAKYGVFMHFLPGDAQGLALVRDFDVETLAGQLGDMVANYFVLTLGQNSGYMNSPNAAYEKRTGYAPGERCPTRDLPLDLYHALQPKGIRLMLYLPCQVPNEDAKAQKAFGLPQSAKDQPIDLAFAEKWSEVIQEWSDRYGDKVAGWWFDGGYEHIGFNDAIAERYAAAIKHGNPKAIVTFNPGVKVIRWTKAEDYTAGELNEPLQVVPAGRWLAGSQWHALTYMGDNWSLRNTRFTDGQWADWARKVTAQQGVLTLDMGPNHDPANGPIGSLAEAQVKQFKAIRAALSQGASTVSPKRLKRSESFFGIHFDFHAGMDCTEIGKNTSREMVEKIIDQTHPDYIQIDCKGHPGLSSYPTKVGNQAPGFVGDPLKIWREVTAERGVGLYMHYSGVWDSEAIRKNPTWAVVNANGATNKNATSFFGPYEEKLLIPQLRELAGVYGVDGAWVDGECWASEPDFGETALKAFTASTGIQEIPRQPSDPHWFEFLQFNRDAFRQYLRRYVTEVKKTNPAIQLCSNWAFTDHMPEAVCAPVDWISGDFTPEDSVNSARMSGRYTAQQGKPWDLMAWSFVQKGETRNGSRQKSAIHLQREAAVVMAQGGGFQPYYNQRRDGSVPEQHLPVIAEVAKFCRARQAFCQGATPVPQIALLYSTASHYREINDLFGRDLSRLNGTLQALIESQQTVDVVSEHSLKGRMSAYPLRVVAECDYLEPEFKKELTEYVQQGGNLLLVGPQAASLFAADIGVTLENAQQGPRYVECGGTLAATRDQTRTAKLDAKAKALGVLHAADDANSVAQPAASITALGKGRMAATYFSFSRGYLADRSPQMRSFLNDLVRELFPAPLVVVKGSGAVDVSVNRLKNKLAINLVNTSGAHWDMKKTLFDSIDPVGPLEISLRATTKPASIRLQPEGKSLSFEYQGGVARLTVPRVEIHNILLVE